MLVFGGELICKLFFRRNTDIEFILVSHGNGDKGASDIRMVMMDENCGAYMQVNPKNTNVHTLLIDLTARSFHVLNAE